MLRLILKIYYVLSIPISIFFILNSKQIHKSYYISIIRKFKLGFKMFFNTIRIPTATLYKVHLTMALKILESPPDVPGDVIECGTYKGGSVANLSLVCRIVGRKLKIYDSFKGLPEGKPGDREAIHYQKGEYLGTLNEVKQNIKQHGAIECCEFIQGWFEDTLPNLASPVLLAFFDVDLEASLHTCVKYIWPYLVDRGYIFIDECVGTNHVALFYSEKWWSNIETIREKAECADRSIFKSLDNNDILFIDSSHIIRPQGDVLYEYLEILPILRNGVIVHIHDIFTPKDYKDIWILEEIMFWNEQYLLEAFLSFNNHFKIIGALNYLKHNYFEELSSKCPILKKEPEKEPGSFYIRKI